MTTQAATLAFQPTAGRDRACAEQHTLRRSALLHLLPGVFILVPFVATAPLAMQAGFPPLTAMLLGGMLAGLAFQFGHLLYEGKKRNGTWSLRGIVLYRDPMPAWQYAALVPAFIVAAFLLDGITAPLTAALFGPLAWLPAWFWLRDPALLLQYSRTSVQIVFGLYLLLNGIAAPIIEELYFRGYLMPRLERFGRWTPVIAVALFTLYHFWQPYYFVTQFLATLPLVSAVWWKRNILLGILTHCALNLIGGLLTFGLVLGQM